MAGQHETVPHHENAVQKVEHELEHEAEKIAGKVENEMDSHMHAPLPSHMPQTTEPHAENATTEKPAGTPASLSDQASGDAEKAPGAPLEEVSPRNVHGIKWALAVTSILISTFLFALDNTIVADIQPAIVDRFGQVGKISWLAVAFLIAAIGTNLFWYV